MRAGLACWARLPGFGRGTMTAEKLGLTAKWLKEKGCGPIEC